MRTLIVSDFHLGARLRHDVLQQREPLQTLLAALDDVERLVLLGDVVELLEGRPAHAMAVAEPVLRAIGTRLGAEREVIVVPGNHDGALVRPWVRAQGPSLAVDAVVPPHATPLLSRLVSWLAPSRVRVHYPGAWVAEGVWATHGHYLDRHLLPESAYGIARGLLGRLPRDGATPSEYEWAGGPSLTRLEAFLTRWLPGPLARLWDDLTEFLRAGTMPASPERLLSRPAAQLVSRRTARLQAMLLGVQMRRASIPALARVVHRLGVQADWVIFGHVHRCGPLDGDDPAQWQGPDGTPRIVNTGSWTYEPLLVHRAIPPHPYWPGSAIVLEDGSQPRAVGLLDRLDEALLH